MRTTSIRKNLRYDKKYDQDEAFLATMEAVKRELLGQYALTQEMKISRQHRKNVSILQRA